MDTQWLPGLPAAIAGVVFALSWLGARKPARPRPEPAAPAPPPAAKLQRVALVLNPIKNDAEAARRKVA
ncbi:diacylglycerol kinase family lipid kinase, partial [Arthrobacter deserti]|nr:diacylglycerol kinase family lipid kinase [Arthrobacter deserti]